MTPPSRRQVLTAGALALLAGCLDQESQSEDENGDDNDDSDDNENEDPEEAEPRSEDMVIEVWFIDEVPSSLDPIPSDDDRVDGVGFFPEIFETVADEDYERGTVRSAEYGEFEAFELYESDATSSKAEATQEAYDELPEQSPDGLPTAPYLEHEDEVITIRLLVGQEE